MKYHIRKELRSWNRIFVKFGIGGFAGFGYFIFFFKFLGYNFVYLWILLSCFLSTGMGLLFQGGRR